MKKGFLILAMIFGLVASAAAQIHIGTRANISYDTWWGFDDAYDDSFGEAWGVGYGFGVSAKIGINEMLSVVPGVELEFREATFELENYNLVTLEAGFSQMFLDIPVLLRAQLNPMFFVEVGPEFALNLGTDFVYEVAGIDLGVDASDAFNTFELNLAVGAGVAISPKMDIDVRFVLGLTNQADNSASSLMGDDDDDDDYSSYYDDEEEDTEPDMVLKNWQIQVGFTYWFM